MVSVKVAFNLNSGEEKVQNLGYFFLVLLTYCLIFGVSNTCTHQIVENKVKDDSSGRITFSHISVDQHLQLSHHLLHRWTSVCVMRRLCPASQPRYSPLHSYGWSVFADCSLIMSYTDILRHLRNSCPSDFPYKSN